MTPDPSMLEGAEIFGGLDADGRRAVLRAGVLRRRTAGTTIFSQGDPGSTCHTLVEGRLKILQTRPDGGRSLIRCIGPGEMFGTVAALMDRPFPADAIAVVDSLEVSWTVATMRELMRRHPLLALQSTVSAGGRLLELQGRLGELAGDRVEQRIACALVRLIQQAGRPTSQGVEVDFPITRQELAEMAGSTLHTVSRTLSAWNAARITACSRRRVVVLKPEALRAIAGGA